MKFMVSIIILCVVSVRSMGVPKRMIPRLPTSVLLNGNYQMIPGDRIVGGSVVEPNSLPFQVSLQRRSSFGNPYFHYCGGSILDANVVITSASCVSGFSEVNLSIKAGEHSLSQDDSLEQWCAVLKYKIHEEYNSFTFENDVALLFLELPLVMLAPSAQAINLPTSVLDLPAETVVTISGWGTTEFGGEVSDLLRSVDIPVVDDDICNTKYGGDSNNILVFPSMLCAGDMNNGGVDSCQGDLGGPLFTGTGSDAVQHGIVSWGQGCAQAAYPGVYTQVSYFLEWIAINRSGTKVTYALSAEEHIPSGKRYLISKNDFKFPEEKILSEIGDGGIKRHQAVCLQMLYNPMTFRFRKNLFISNYTTLNSSSGNLPSSYDWIM